MGGLEYGWILAGLVIFFNFTLTMTSDFNNYGYPKPCTDLQPIYLLNLVAPGRNSLPLGMEILFDEEVSIHSYKFKERAATISFPSSVVFSKCDFFPEEFSILITLKVGPTSVENDECLFSLIPSGTRDVKLGVRLYKGKLHFDYTDRLTKRRKVASFTKVPIFDTRWHTLIFSISEDRLSLKIDCGKAKIKRLKRVVPALLNVKNNNIHVANCNGRNSLFSGNLKQLLVLPGADVSVLTCPSDSPSVPDVSILPGIGPDYPTVPVPPSVASNSICTWRDTGKTWFDFNHRQLKVCYSGLWQPIIQEREEKKIPKLDYVVWHQDLITGAPTIDLEVFTIPGHGVFLAAASYSDSTTDLKKQQSAIFKWDGSRFTLYQSLYTLGAQGWRHFVIDKQYFLAVANNGPDRKKPFKSVIYRWSMKKKRFVVFQELVTWTAKKVEYFTIDEKHYIAVANHVKGQNHSINSMIYKWDVNENLFKEFQTITTLGAFDWTYFHVEGFHFLVVANAFSGPPIQTTKIDSVIYLWSPGGPSEDGKFMKFQTLETYGATDWEFFRIEDENYLVVANALNYGPHVTKDSPRYTTNSTIYRLNKHRQEFEVYQSIPTYSAVDWEYFMVGKDHYLIVSNAQQEAALPENQRSIMYRWQGMEKFVPVHFLDTFPSTDWEFFSIDQHSYIAYSNANNLVSQIFKIVYE